MVPPPSKRAKRKAQRDANDLLVLGDFLMTCLWTFVSSLFLEAIEFVRPDAVGTAEELALITALTVLAVMVFAPLANLFGGALWNPVHNAAMIVAGAKGTLQLNMVRMLSQTAGALVGSYAAMFLLPAHLTDTFHKLPGRVRQGVALPVGFASEALMGAVLNIVVLYSFETHRKRVAYYLPLLLTVALNFVGSHFTGPGLNPAITFSWYHHYPGVHEPGEHVLVYWVAPLVGAVAAGWLFRRLYMERTTIALPLGGSYTIGRGKKEA